MTPATTPVRPALLLALAVNGSLFAFNIAASAWLKSAALLADTMVTLAVACACGLALWANSRSAACQRKTARCSANLLLTFGVAIALDVTWRAVFRSEPHGATMMALAAPSLIASIAVLGLLSPLRHGPAHLRTAWIFARMDVLAKVGVALASLRVWLDGPRLADLVVALVIGIYLISQANRMLSRDDELHQLSEE